ncbi:unnamed protein product [Timema podura]|uniref:acid phosphatase n=1 Tax=Timema podura TaxID=61482 RepID=A0ABN7NUH9_TIMPD|nr:unnamed protein product [Timema podura]
MPPLLMKDIQEFLRSPREENSTLGPLIDEIVSLMIDKQMGQLNPDRKLFMYSGHDSQVFSLLRALRVFNGLHVPYAAAVLIELRRAGDNHVVTVMYRNTTRTEPYLLRIPGCDTQCPLKTFVQLMKDLIPVNYEMECAETYNDDLDTNFQVPLLGLPDEWQDCFD